MSPSNETQLLAAIVGVLKMVDGGLHHDRPARTEHGWRTAVQGDEGFPDLVIAAGGVYVFRELKGPYEKLSPAQYRWSQWLSPGWAEERHAVPDHEAEVVFDIWRPMHWDTRILPFLNRLRRASLDYRSLPVDGGQRELPAMRDRGTALGRVARRGGS